MRDFREMRTGMGPQAFSQEFDLKQEFHRVHQRVKRKPGGIREGGRKMSAVPAGVDRRTDRCVQRDHEKDVRVFKFVGRQFLNRLVIPVMKRNDLRKSAAEPRREAGIERIFQIIRNGHRDSEFHPPFEETGDFLFRAAAQQSRVENVGTIGLKICIDERTTVFSLNRLFPNCGLINSNFSDVLACRFWKSVSGIDIWGFSVSKAWLIVPL